MVFSTKAFPASFDKRSKNKNNGMLSLLTWFKFMGEKF
jgi:hypothetical protein